MIIVLIWLGYDFILAYETFLEAHRLLLNSFLIVVFLC